MASTAASEPFGGLPDDSIALVLGTRPEIIKLAEIIRLLGPAAHIVHTGQHYDPTLAEAFFTDFGLPAPDVQLAVGGSSRGHMIGEATALLDAHFEAKRPKAVLVQGDTNAVLAGALAANAREIPLVHIEAGLRSRDRAMPEEHNRVVADHLSDLCCAPTSVSRDNLLAESIDPDRIVVTGNTVVEAVRWLLPDHEQREATLERLGLERGRFILSTFHRPENVDEPDRLETILSELASLRFPVVLPIHPRTAERIRRFGLGDLLNKLVVTDPLAYPDFLGLTAESALLVSDSGGVQEEVSVLKRPVIVVRNSTERPEVLGTFAELVPPGPRIGDTANGWLEDLDAVHTRLAEEPSPYGDGEASRRSLDAVAELVAGRPA